MAVCRTSIGSTRPCKRREQVQLDAVPDPGDGYGHPLLGEQGVGGQHIAITVDSRAGSWQENQRRAHTPPRRSTRPPQHRVERPRRSSGPGRRLSGWDNTRDRSAGPKAVVPAPRGQHRVAVVCLRPALPAGSLVSSSQSMSSARVRRRPAGGCRQVVAPARATTARGKGFTSAGGRADAVPADRQRQRGHLRHPGGAWSGRKCAALSTLTSAPTTRSARTRCPVTARSRRHLRRASAANTQPTTKAPIAAPC